MYYAVHQEDYHDSNAKSLSPGYNALNTHYFSGRDSLTIKPKEIITSKQLAQLILTQGITLFIQSFPIFCVLLLITMGFVRVLRRRPCSAPEPPAQAVLPETWHCRGSLHPLGASQGSQRHLILVPAGSTGPGTPHLNPWELWGFHTGPPER